MRFAWLEVGCLECHNPTTFRAVFESEADAREAVRRQYPHALNGPPVPVMMRVGDESPEDVLGTEGFDLILEIT